MYYCQVLKNLRESNYYTQEYIAKILNVGQRTYCDYELGKTRIPIDSIIKLAMLYNVDLNYICGISNKKIHFLKNKFLYAGAGMRINTRVLFVSF